MLRTYGFSENFDILWRGLAQNHMGQAESRRLCHQVMTLSDHFIQEKGLKTPWALSDAYELYFHPLNYLRSRRVIEQAHQRGFFDKISHIVDWGAGCGALTRALFDELPRSLTRLMKVVAVDDNPKALERHKLWCEGTFTDIRYTQPANFHQAGEIPWRTTCLALSYSLNEMKSVPLMEKGPEALLILEPSTHTLAQKLQRLRGEMQQLGYYAYSPCTHQDTCPLLTESKKDWCHDRLHWQAPELWDQIFKTLPIKNGTLTHSSMSLRKTAPSPTEAQARVVSDELTEKGRTRWWVCTGAQRLSLSWLSRWGPPPPWKRGELIEFPQDLAESLRQGGELKVTPEIIQKMSKT